MIELNEKNHTVLARIGRMQFIRVKTEKIEKFIITSGGENPDYYLEQRTYENASKAWGKIHKEMQKDDHKSYMEDLEAEYDEIVGAENNPKLPFDAGKELDIAVKAYLAPFSLGSSITNKELQEAFDIDEPTAAGIIHRLICNKILSVHVSAGSAPIYKIKKPTEAAADSVQDPVYPEIVKYLTSLKAKNGGAVSELHIKHKFALDDDRFSIVMQQLVAGKVLDKESNASTRKILLSDPSPEIIDNDPVYDAVLDFLRSYDAITDQEIQDGFNFTKTKTTIIVDRLVSDGVVGFQDPARENSAREVLIDADGNKYADDSKSETQPSDNDGKYQEALILIAGIETVSISQLQRELKIGFASASKIVEQLEQNGMIGPRVGNKPRKVLVDNEGEAADNG